MLFSRSAIVNTTAVPRTFLLDAMADSGASGGIILPIAGEGVLIAAFGRIIAPPDEPAPRSPVDPLQFVLKEDKERQTREAEEFVDPGKPVAGVVIALPTCNASRPDTLSCE